MKNKAKIVATVYSFGVACVLALVAYTIYCYYAFWAGSWHGPYLSFFSPSHILNTYTMAALGVGTIPMTIACIAFYKFGSIDKSRHRFWKFNIIFLPAYICALIALTLLVVVPLDMFLAYGMRNF